MSILDRVKKKTNRTVATPKKTSNSRTASAALSNPNLFILPYITEKSTAMNAKNVYVFRVPLTSEKLEISRAVKSKYGVTPLMVRTVRSDGKMKRFGAREGKRPDWKKAYVTIAAGETITIATPKAEELAVTEEKES